MAGNAKTYGDVRDGDLGCGDPIQRIGMGKRCKASGGLVFVIDSEEKFPPAQNHKYTSPGRGRARIGSENNELGDRK